MSLALALVLALAVALALPLALALALPLPLAPTQAGSPGFCEGWSRRAARSTRAWRGRWRRRRRERSGRGRSGARGSNPDPNSNPNPNPNTNPNPNPNPSQAELIALLSALPAAAGSRAVVTSITNEMAMCHKDEDNQRRYAQPRPPLTPPRPCSHRALALPKAAPGLFR